MFKEGDTIVCIKVPKDKYNLLKNKKYTIAICYHEFSYDNICGRNRTLIMLEEIDNKVFVGNNFKLLSDIRKEKILKCLKKVT